MILAMDGKAIRFGRSNVTHGLNDRDRYTWCGLDADTDHTVSAEIRYPGRIAAVTCRSCQRTVPRGR